jgi:hypothetical protein
VHRVSTGAYEYVSSKWLILLAGQLIKESVASVGRCLLLIFSLLRSLLRPLCAEIGSIELASGGWLWI